MEDHARPVLGDVPAPRERGLELEGGVERGQGLVELGRDGRVDDVRPRRRVERRRLAGQDPDLVAIGSVDRDAAHIDQDRADDDQEGHGDADRAPPDVERGQARHQSSVRRVPPSNIRGSSRRSIATGSRTRTEAT